MRSIVLVGALAIACGTAASVTANDEGHATLPDGTDVCVSDGLTFAIGTRRHDGCFCRIRGWVCDLTLDGGQGDSTDPSDDPGDISDAFVDRFEGPPESDALIGPIGDSGVAPIEDASANSGQ